MKIFFQLILLASLYGCVTSEFHITKSQRKIDATSIKQMTIAIENNPEYFLSNVILDTLGIAHEIDSLGFNYSIEQGGYNLNDRVYFWLKIIRYNDSILSFSASPFFWRVPGAYVGIYNRFLKSAGWTITKHGFNNKYFNYEVTVLPMNPIPLVDYKHKATIDSLMTPYTGYEYVNYDLLKSKWNEKRVGKITSKLKEDAQRFENIASKLSNDELFYLLNGINPSTRAYTIKFLKCNKHELTDKEKTLITKLINKSPPIKGIYAGSDIITDFNLTDLIQCK